MNIYLSYFARYISYLFVPPSFTFLIFLYLGLTLSISQETTVLTIGSGLVLGLLIPVVFFLFLMKHGKVGDSDASVKEERNIPYIFGIVLSFAGFAFTALYDLPRLVQVIWIVHFADMITLLVINKFWKISAHALGSATPLGLLVFLFGYTGLLYLPVLLIISWSRIYLRRHTISQVIAGGILGFLLSFVCISIFS